MSDDELARRVTTLADALNRAITEVVDAGLSVDVEWSEPLDDVWTPPAPALEVRVVRPVARSAARITTLDAVEARQTVTVRTSAAPDGSAAMSEQLEPALTPAQWANHRIESDVASLLDEGEADEAGVDGKVSWHIEAQGLVLCYEQHEGALSTVTQLGFGHRAIPCILALANAALPNGGERKLTLRHAAAVADAAEAGPDDVLDRPALREAAAILASLLPAREG